MERTVPIETLLQHAGFVRGLARHLLHDPAGEDDAVQETWRTALEHPPRSSGSPRAWLARVLRNRVRQDARAQGRRMAREHAAARGDRVEAAVDGVARAEIAERMAQAVARLEEPYRSAILLRYYEGLPPRVMAVRLDTPVETVKSQLKRGRERLRAQLETRAPSWRLALAPIAGVDASLLAPHTSTLGVLLMGTQTKLVIGLAAAALLAVGGWYLFTDTPAPSGDLTAEHEPGTPLADPDGGKAPSLRTVGSSKGTPDPQAGAGTPTPPAKDDGAQPATPPARGVATGVITSTEAGVLRGTVRVRLPGGDRATHTTTIDSDGTFRFEGLPSGQHTLIVDVDGRETRRIPIRVTAKAPTRIAVTLGTASLWGIAYDELGRPREGAAVRIATLLVHGEEGYANSAEGSVFGSTILTGPDGRYEFADLPRGTYTIVGQLAAGAASSSRNIRSFKVRLRDGETRRLDLGEAYEDPTWAGRVRYLDGEPVTRAGNIFLSSDDGERRMYVNFDKEGRFSEQVPVGTYRMEFVLPRPRSATALPGMRLIQTAQRLEIGGHGSTTDAVLPGARLTGTISNPGPHPKQTLHITRTKTTGTLPASLISKNPSASERVGVGADGHFTIDGLQAGTYRITGSAHAASTRVEVVEGQAVVQVTLHLTK